MRRRFSRGRRRNGGNDAAPIDAAHWLPRILEVGAVEAAQLEAFELPGVPTSFAALGQGEDASGRPLIVAFSPTRGADAALAALAAGARRAAEDAPPAALHAVAPDWNAADRRRWALFAPRLGISAVAASALAEGGVRIAPEPSVALSCEPSLVAGCLSRADERALFERALTGLDGLAAKHGGVLRGVEDRADLWVLARRAASLVAEPGRLRIEVLEPDRATHALNAPDGLSTALDRLEGALRKLLNDRRLRTSEAGIRAALAPILERAAGITTSARWPLAGSDAIALDWIGFDEQGRTVCGAIRESLTLPVLAEILDAAAATGAAAGELGRRAGRPPRRGAPMLALAGVEFEASVLEACAASGLGLLLYDAATRRSGDWSLEEKTVPSVGEAVAVEPERPERTERTERPARSAREDEPREKEASEDASAPSRDRERGSRRGRGRRSSGRNEEKKDAESESSPAAAGGIEEVSLFDLDDDGGSGDESGDSRRRRSRGRRRGRRGRGREPRAERSGSEGGDGNESGDGGSSESGGGRGRGRRRAARPEPAEDVDDDPILEADDDEIAPLAADAPELDDDADPAGYEDDDGDEDEDDEGDRQRSERERRRRQRAAKPPEPPPAPRRRAAFLAHADPVSILTAVVLARDVRLVESFRVYPQAELMTFFRSVATDLKEGTPIFLVGFAASQPARDTLQAASLYSGRLDWFDHHDWPPEDLVALRETLGEDHVHVTPGAECSLAAVIAERTRRSRFSDKLVELITGRFSQHDYERWGRWWWHRASEIAANPGERKPDVEPLLAGRPSDLAREAARRPEPDLPPELAFVSGKDFRLVHFGGMSMVVLEVPLELDIHLASRIARERYDTPISLALRPNEELVVLGGDDSRSKRGLDLGGMTAHLQSKHAWVEALPDDDHVARMRVRRLHDHPGRLDELITEIAMGRSIVEG